MYKQITTSVSYTISQNVKNVLVYNTNTPITLTLPDATAYKNREISIARFSNTDLANITLVSAGGNIQEPSTNQLQTTVLLTSFYRCVEYISDGIDWHTISAKTIDFDIDFTLAGGKTLTVNNTLTLQGTDGATLTFQGTDTYVGRATTDALTNKSVNGVTLVSGGTPTLYLSQDGTYRTPSGGGGSPGGSTTQLQYNNAGTFAGITGATTNGTVVTLTTPILGTPTSVTLTNATGLPITTGVSGMGAGVAAFLATPTAANLITAVTDKTGTGNLVFATSPTLITPNLGTPSAIVLTNATGIPAAQLSGIIPTGVLGASTLNIGTTSIALNRASASQALTGITSIDGFAAAVTLTADNTTNATNYPLFVNAATGNLSPRTDTGFTYNPSTGALTSTSFIGALTGNASTATSAATLTTARAINGVNFDGSSAITVTAAAGTLTGATLAASVTTSSLTSVGTITSGTWSGSFGAVSGANLTGLTAGNLSGTIPSAVLGNSAVFIGTTSIALNRASANQVLTGILSTTFAGSTSGTTVLIPTAIAGTTTITLPAVTGTVVTTGDSATVTNTMLAGSITNAKLTNSTISGIALGANLATLTIGTGLTGTSYNGSGAVTVAINSSVLTDVSTHTLTNKTFDTAGIGNSFSINGLAVTANTGTGAVVRATSPTLTTPILGVASATSINKLTITTPITGSTLTIADGKTLTASNTLTFTGTDNSSIAFEAGGTVLYSGGVLGTPSSVTLTNGTGLPISTGVSGLGTGVVTFLATPSSVNLAAAITDETGNGALVFATSPTLVTPNLGTPSTLVGTNITGTAAGLTAGNVTTNANLTGEVTSIGNEATLTNSAVIGKVLTGYVSGAGTVAATDTIIQAIQKLNANDATNANLTGMVTSVGNATTVVTNANLTGVITSVGNTTSLGSFTSAQLATALTDETGSGASVFATSPTLVTPVLGVATATSINKLTITAPTTGATLTIVDGGSLITAGAFSTTLTSTATTNVTLPTTGTLSTLAGTETLTNKRINPRVQSITSSATVTLNADTDDLVVITAQAVGLTLASPSGTPVQGQAAIFRIKDNGTARSITFNAIFRTIGVTLPTTTTLGKILYISTMYNSIDTKWDVLGIALEA
jgi:hypothetical protein